MITQEKLKRERTVSQLNPSKVSIVESNVISLNDTDQQFDWYTKVRLMRRDPTIALVRALIVSGPLSAGWSIQSTKEAPKGALEFIQGELSPIRFHLVKTSLLGCTDFGWQPFEKVFVHRADGSTGIGKLKPLIHDDTQIRVIKKSGRFNGFYQRQIKQYNEVFLSRRKSLLYNFDVEGTNWYGNATMRNVEGPYDRGLILNDSSQRYDEKIAGSHWVIHYPIGTSEVNGKETDNYDIALSIESRLKASGVIIVPRELQRWISDLNMETNEDAWKIELISASGNAGISLINKAKYYDMLMVRGLGFPERSVTEGKHGTKADAGEHGDFAFLNLQMRHNEIILTTNWHLVNQLLVENYGPGTENTVFIKANEVVDKKKRALKELYFKILGNPKLIETEVTNIDFKTIRDILDIPESENTTDFELPVSSGVL